MESRRLVIDTETTGLTPGTHEIIEFTALDTVFYTKENGLMDYEVRHKFTSLIKPDRLSIMSDEAMKVNGIDLAELGKAPRPMAVRGNFYSWWKEVFEGDGDIIVLGQNFAGFDKPFLELFFGKAAFDEMFYYRH